MTGPMPRSSLEGVAGTSERPVGRTGLFLERHFRSAAALLLLTMAVTQFAAMHMETVANDEGFYLLSGYQYLKTGKLPLGTEHPPLGEVIPALPLLFLNLHVPGRPLIVLPDQSEQRAREQQFLYANRYSAETILLFARTADILVTMLLGVVLLWWTRRHFGAIPALAVVALFSFDPNFIAHGHYAMTDLPVTLGFLLGVLSWNVFLAEGRSSKAAICGVSTGIAIAIKYNAVLLIPIYVLLYLVRWWQHGHCSLRHLARSMAVVGALAFLAVYAVFGFE